MAAATEHEPSHGLTESVAAGPARPRVLFVSRERHRLPLPADQRRKWDAIGMRLDFRVLAATRDPRQRTDDRFHLVRPLRVRRLDGLAFYLLLPMRVTREIASFRPDAIVVQGVHEAAAVLLGRRLAGASPVVILEIQGDWRAATRLYGSRARRLLNPIGDALGRFSVRRADSVRTISKQTTQIVRELGVEPAATFAPYVDAANFNERPTTPLPAEQRIVFIGVLERYKGLDVLIDAWPTVVGRVPDAELHIVGTGRLAKSVADLGDRYDHSVSWTSQLEGIDIAAVMDNSVALCLPSRLEGLGRVVVEAMCRARPVVGGNAGGIPDIVVDNRNGLLVRPGDSGDLAAALVRILSDRPCAERLARAARHTAADWIVSPGQFADRIGRLVATSILRAEPPRKRGGPLAFLPNRAGQSSRSG